MKSRVLLLLIFLIKTQVIYSQNDRLTREAGILELPVDGKQVYSMEIQKAKFFVDDKVLQLYPGDSLFIEMDVKKKEISEMKVVKENLNPDKTLEISFSQSVKNGISEGMTLKIVNPFNKDLKYKALMYIVGHDEWINTNVYPVKGNLISYEIWNDVVITLILSDWEFL